jgi:PAS domain S-box-containing protein
VTALDDLGVLDAIPEPLLLVTADERVAAVNRALARQLGLTPSSVVGRPLRDLLDGSAERASEYLRLCARSAQMVPGTFTLRPAKGEAVVFRADGARCHSESGAAAHILIRLTLKRETVTAFMALNERINALNAEIARRRHLEELLVRQRELLEVTLASIADAVIATDAQARVTFMNPVAATLIGRDLVETTDRPLAEIFALYDEPTGEPVPDPLSAVLAAEGEVRTITQAMLRRADGQQIPIEASAAPIRLSGGVLSGFVLSFRDVTAQRQAERDRFEADRRMDEFLAILAHELRNPLAPIRNAMQIMRLAEGDLATAAASRVIVERQLKHLTRLIDDLMDVSRITQGKFELRRDLVALSAVLQIGVEIARPQLEAKQHPLQIELPGEGLYLLADLNRLAQVFANLLENASKYSPAGTPIRIEATATEREIVVRVVDQGIGIPAEMLERIFDLFTQVDRSGNGTLEGLGIGLTLVRRIVQLHAGSVIAESAGRDAGSSFTVRLPRATLMPHPDTPSEPIPQHPATRMLRILVVDDNRDAANTLATMLRLDGHDVRAVHDGAAALATGDTFHPDLVLLDIGMPVVDGYAAARLIRKRPWGKQTHLVALTGWGQDADRRKAFAAGFHDHLVKPAAPEAVAAVIRQVLARPGASHAAGHE